MGYNVNWDPATKNIGMTSPFGQSTSLAPDQYSMQGDRAYLDTGQMQSLFLNPDYFKPAQLTPDNIKQNYSTAQQMYSPMQDFYNQAYEKQLSALSRMSQGQQGLVESAYGQAQTNLGRQEDAARRTTSHNVAGRNISNSPLAAYQKRKVTEAYAPEYQQLESNRGAQLANIANNAIAASEQLAAAGLQQQAAFAMRIGEAAFNMAQQQANAPQAWAQNSLAALTGMANRQLQQGQLGLQQDKFGYEQERAAQFDPLELQLLQAQIGATNRSNTGGGGGGGGTAAKTQTLAELAKAAAQNDPRLWMGDTDPPEGRWTLEGLQNAYINNQGGTQQASTFDPETSDPSLRGSDPMMLMIQQAKAQGLSAAQIRGGLAAEGVDPSKYGY